MGIKDDRGETVSWILGAITGLVLFFVFLYIVFKSESKYKYKYKKNDWKDEGSVLNKGSQRFIDTGRFFGR